VNGITLNDGRIRHPDGRRTLTYGQVAAEAAKMAFPANPTLRTDPPSAGRSLWRWDIPAKVDGSAQFGIDVKLPEMLVATVRCAPRVGSKLAAYDPQSIKSRPGVLAVVEVPNGITAVARTYWQARRALDEAELAWSEEGSEFTSSSTLGEGYAARLAEGPFFTHHEVGEPAAVRDAAATLEATYQLPFEAHATLEPMNCTAAIANGHCDIWVPTQGMEMAQTVAAQVTGLSPDRITIHRTLLGGGFGRRLLADFIKQTLLVAM